jgi:hypothetical protein
MEQYLRSAAEEAKEAEARALAKADEGVPGPHGGCCSPAPSAMHAVRHHGQHRGTSARVPFPPSADFTPAWRSVGLPLKPSHLHLDPGAMAGARLVNPKSIVQVGEPHTDASRSGSYDGDALAARAGS